MVSSRIYFEGHLPIAAALGIMVFIPESSLKSSLKTLWQCELHELCKKVVDHFIIYLLDK